MRFYLHASLFLLFFSSLFLFSIFSSHFFWVYSLFCQIFGAYKLHMYGISMHFFVMNNILQNPEHVLMNEKYDIKGSWVKRHATPPQDGMQVTCMHCEQKYTYRKKRRVFGRIDSIASAAAANFSARTLTISGE